MPRELTAENGAKALLMGKFKESINVPCDNCIDGVIEYDSSVIDCKVCAGHGTVNQEVTISWTTIKEIYKMAVEHLEVDR
jgi:DnaJ-class molecular chaperone